MIKKSHSTMFNSLFSQVFDLEARCYKEKLPVCQFSLCLPHYDFLYSSIACANDIDAALRRGDADAIESEDG